MLEPLFGLGTPHWVDDPDFALDYHLRRLRVPEPATPRQLLEQAQWIAMTPFDRARPPWEVALIEGLADGRAAYVLKLHHALSDGHGMMQLLSQAHSRSPEPGLLVERPARKPAAPLPSSGGFRRYHEQLGQPIAKLPIVFPVSVRTAADGLGGNRFVGGQLDAPLDEPDPVACMKKVGAFVEKLREEPALDVLLRVMPVVGRLPTPLLSKMMSGVTAAQDVQASNVPGLRRPVYIAGARVTHFFSFGPMPGCAAMFSHDQRCCIGINTDAAAVREPDRLVECLRLGFDEIIGIPGITQVFAGPDQP